MSVAQNAGGVRRETTISAGIVRADRKLEIVWSQDDLMRRTRMERLVLRWCRRLLVAVAALVVAVVLVVVAGALVAETALRPPRRPLDPAATGRARALAGRLNARLDDVPLIGNDGAVLHAWSFTRSGPARGTVILLHGVGDSRVSQLGLAGLLVADGYRVLVPDSRAHGSSGGDIVTGGVLEHGDLRAWADLVRRAHPDECVFPVAVSLGATAVVRTLGAEPFCAAVLEAPFVSVRSMALYRVGGWPKLPLAVRRLVFAPFIQCGLWYVSARYGIDLRRPDPLAGVRGSHVPVLVIVDGADDEVAIADAKRLASANPTHVTLWTVPGAPHVQGWKTAPDEYPKRVLDFLAAHQ
jgi:pimeloyl-ACP methyl ester carboxylesterase